MITKFHSEPKPLPLSNKTTKIKKTFTCLKSSLDIIKADLRRGHDGLMMTLVGPAQAVNSFRKVWRGPKA